MGSIETMRVEMKALLVGMVACIASQSVDRVYGNTQIVPKWGGSSPRDLHREYNNIFKYGNRNAASHLWYSFVNERAPQMTHDRFETVSSGYCAVSGSPVTPSDHTRYLLRLQSVQGGGKMVAGFMYYCCWPCVCDTQDFLKVDTANITLAGEVRQYYVVVIGNPCENEAALDKPFVQPFYGRETTTLRRGAVRQAGQPGRCQPERPRVSHRVPFLRAHFDRLPDQGCSCGQHGTAAARPPHDECLRSAIQ